MWPVRLGAVAGIGAGWGAGRGGGAVVGLVEELEAAGAAGGAGACGGAGRGGGAVGVLVEGLDVAGEAGAVAGIGEGWGAGRGGGAAGGVDAWPERGVVVRTPSPIPHHGGPEKCNRGGRGAAVAGIGEGGGAVRGGGAAGVVDAWPERAGGAVAGIGEAVGPVEEVGPSSGWWGLEPRTCRKPTTNLPHKKPVWVLSGRVLAPLPNPSPWTAGEMHPWRAGARRVHFLLLVPSSGWSRCWMRPVRRGAVGGFSDCGQTVDITCGGAAGRWMRGRRAVYTTSLPPHPVPSFRIILGKSFIHCGLCGIRGL
jgi:hypothetical protein